MRVVSRVMLGKPVLCTLPSPPRASVSLFPLRASWLDGSSLCRPSTVSERQKSHAGPRQAGPSYSACKQPPLALARPCCPQCMCWTWNLGATSSRTWTASRWAEARALDGDGPVGLIGQRLIGRRLIGRHARSSSSVEPPSLVCPYYLPASCGWCTPRSQGSGWNSCWSQAHSTSLGTAQPRGPHSPQ